MKKPLPCGIATHEAGAEEGTEGNEAMEYELSRAAAHFIKTADKPTKQRIRDGIEGLLAAPPVGDIKPLQGYPTPAYRLRIGKYRIIYEYKTAGNDTRLYIRDIGARGDIYK